MRDMERRTWPLLGVALIAIAVASATVWLLLPQRPLRYAVHALPADDRTLRLARDAGFDTVVELISWREVEPTEGQFHWQRPDEVIAGAEYYGLDLVLRLDQHPAWASSADLSLNAPPNDLEDYARFVSAVAGRYRGRVVGYVIWNEPNLAREWGGRPPDPAGYVSLLCSAHQAIKSVDPGALVVSAGLAPTNHQDTEAMDDRLYLRAMLEAGAAECFDVLGAHPYGFAFPPTDPRDAHDGLNFARLEDLRDIMVKHGQRHKPVWATELGWTVEAPGENAWLVVTPAQQAQYLVDAFRQAERNWPWLELLAVWYLGDHDRPEWSGYDLLDPSGQPRPAYEALAAMTKARKPAPLDAWWQPAMDRPQVGQSYPVLAGDAVVHLGDSDFSEPWMPLYGARNPSTRWTGIVYLPDSAIGDGSPDPNASPWRLSMRLMQPNAWDNYAWINGRRLQPALPAEDFSGRWWSVTWDVPRHWLQPGPNQVAVTIGRTLPLLQDQRFAWDDLQVSDVVLGRE